MHVRNPDDRVPTSSWAFTPPLILFTVEFMVPQPEKCKYKASQDDPGHELLFSNFNRQCPQLVYCSLKADKLHGGQATACHKIKQITAVKIRKSRFANAESKWITYIILIIKIILWIIGNHRQFHKVPTLHIAQTDPYVCEYANYLHHFSEPQGHRISYVLNFRDRGLLWPPQQKRAVYWWEGYRAVKEFISLK